MKIKIVFLKLFKAFLKQVFLYDIGIHIQKWLIACLECVNNLCLQSLRKTLINNVLRKMKIQSSCYVKHCSDRQWFKNEFFSKGQVMCICNSSRTNKWLNILYLYLSTRVVDILLLIILAANPTTYMINCIVIYLCYNN